MIIAVSDIHLGYKKSNAYDFLKFLNWIEGEYKSKRQPKHLVLLGDILDFWRSHNVDAAFKNSRVFQKLLDLRNSFMNVHYIIGNHDYVMLELSKRCPEREWGPSHPFDTKKALRLKDKHNWFYFIHGYELEVLPQEPFTIDNYEDICKSFCRITSILGDFLSFIWSIWKKIRYRTIRKPPEERLKGERKKRMMQLITSPLKNLFLGVREDETLVFGHTHEPFLDLKNKVANTGSWVSERKQRVTNTYLKIENGEPKLCVFNEVSG